MRPVRTLALLAVLAASAPAWTQSTAAQAPPTPLAWSQNMDRQMQSMRELHDKMLAARMPEERSKLMAEQMKLMQGGMDMMGGMGPGMGMRMAGPGIHPDAAAGRQGAMPMGAPDAGTRMQMIEKRMEMMQSMMQMMMDRTAPAPVGK